MAHRKLQQEVDKVFKKINEGLEIFDTYYERHEACTNNPSQKDKLESDLKREVKKLQRLREQIKSWQSSPDIKDKDALLDYRRSVETAMEKYKAVEKSSKEKAYSNISLKKSENLDPEEQERRDVSEMISQQIDELERQYDLLQIEIDKLLLLNKKKKTASSSNAEKREQFKALQGRYRWHQQQMEITLRLLANEELDTEPVRDVEEDIKYFVESNQEPEFVEDETIYESLDLQSNEAIAHEVEQYFAAQASEDQMDDDDDDNSDSKISKKEQRRLEREAKKFSKTSTKSPGKVTDVSQEEVTTTTSTSPVIKDEAFSSTRENERSISPSPSRGSIDSLGKSISTLPSAPSTGKSPNVSNILSSKISILPSSVSRSATPEVQGHTHIHQSQNGLTTTSTLKPATIPIRPVGELKWAAAASQAMEKTKKQTPIPSTTTLNIMNNPVATIFSQTTGSATSNTGTPRMATPTLSNPSLAQQLEKAGSLSSVTNSPVSAATLLNQTVTKNIDTVHQLANEVSNDVDFKINNQESNHTRMVVIDDYDSDLTDDEIENEPSLEQPSSEEVLRRVNVSNFLKNKYSRNYDMLLLPSGIQEYIMGRVLRENKLNALNGKLGGYRRSLDACHIPRIDSIPIGVNPPTPLDAFRSTHQWDVTRSSLRSIIYNDNLENKFEAILESFRSMEMFALFYNYYFSVTPLEKEIAAAILAEREWKLLSNGCMWFLRQGDVKFSDELCEVGDYKIFKAEDWSVIEKFNFKLDYFSLMDPPTSFKYIDSMSEQETVDDDGLSHGQQLLQQLNRGKSGLTA